MNKVTAYKDTTGLDFMPYRVNIETPNGSRMLCRCDSASDAEMICNALGGAVTVEAMGYNEVMAHIDTALENLKKFRESQKPEKKFDWIATMRPNEKIKVVL